MSVDPIKSKWQTTPWQPTANSSDGDYSDEQSAISAYDAVYGDAPAPSPSGSSSSGPTLSSYAYPTLSTAYSVAPDFIPVPGHSSQGSGASPAVPPAPPFAIRLSDLKSAEQACLNATSETVNDYQTLKSVATAATSSPTFFGQVVGTSNTVGNTNIPNGDSKSGFMGEDPAVTWDQLDSEGKQFATTIIPQMEQLLQAVGNTVEAMGIFSALLNNAGQMYTDADAWSAFPEIDTSHNK